MADLRIRATPNLSVFWEASIALPFLVLWGWVTLGIGNSGPSA
ncbi:MAG: hypothetical protein ABIZ72_10150 [Candidatus Limnocylindrales bacterium]